ncbi:MAG TPA: hypothetical protein VF407_09010 [Polyangiaceae bacterium]
MAPLNLLEPWILLRLVAGLVAVALFARGAWTASKVLRRFDLASANEGQLALEKQVDLASTLVRVATAVQVGSLALAVLAADRLSHGIRGAMCAYGVFHANEWGFRALYSTLAVAVLGGVVAQAYAFDAKLPRLELVKPLAWLTLLMAPLVVIDLALNATFLLNLDLSITASCCSVQLDSAAAGFGGFAEGPRVLVTYLAPAIVALAIAASLLVAKNPKPARVAVTGALSIVAMPIALAAAVLEVAPYAFELPQHVCPFCLLKGDVLAIGYPLFGGILLATMWGGGATLSAFLARRLSAETASSFFEPFARSRLRREALAWAIVLVVGAAPIVRYAAVSNGGSLFP